MKLKPSVVTVLILKGDLPQVFRTMSMETLFSHYKLFPLICCVCLAIGSTNIDRVLVMWLNCLDTRDKAISRTKLHPHAPYLPVGKQTDCQETQLGGKYSYHSLSLFSSLFLIDLSPNHILLYIFPILYQLTMKRLADNSCNYS